MLNLGGDARLQQQPYVALYATQRACSRHSRSTLGLPQTRGSADSADMDACMKTLELGHSKASASALSYITCAQPAA